jgi:Ca-activated chloride channel family protein
MYRYRPHRPPGASGFFVALALVLSTAASAYAQTPAAEEPARSGLLVHVPDGEPVAMPLTALSVDASIRGGLAEVTVEQTFANPFAERVEAVYVFPLPEDAAVTEMVMVIGERRVRAELRERGEARRTYEEARERGQTTALLEQERSNVFTQSVANIEPGHPVRVLISYIDEVGYEDGRYAYAFPTTVGPRFVDGTVSASTTPSGAGMLADTDLVPDASRITPPMLPAGIDAPFAFDFRLDLETGMPIRELSSTSHDLELAWRDEGAVAIALAPEQRRPDRDVVLSWALTDTEPAVGLVSHHDERGGFFALTLEPPADARAEDVRPKELYFVIDMSGSMMGAPLEASKAVIREALRGLNPGDTFQIVRFSDEAAALAPAPLPNTPENVAHALAFVDALSGMGGTNMLGGIRAALEPPADAGRMRIVMFLTDGYIGSESQVFATVEELLGESRIFGLGVGSSPNRHLLDVLSEVGRGAVQYVNLDESPVEVAEAFYRRIRNPVLTDVEIDWGGLDVHDVSPVRIPDVFEGTPIRLAGRFERGGVETIRIRGRRGAREVELPLVVDLAAEPGESDAIPQLWARRRVAAIEQAHAYENGEGVRDAVLPVALEFGILTRFTSFVAVEERVAVDAADPLRTVAVASPLPAGMEDDGVLTHLSPDYVQPGDPELTVCAGDDTLAVTAYFPFGLVQSLDLDFDTGCWGSRFLVPTDMADGEYRILVAIERDGGAVDFEEVPLWVDATAPSFVAGLLPGDRVPVGEVVEVEVRVFDPEATCEAEAATTCAEVLPERVKFVRIYLPDGRIGRMEPSEADPSVWTFFFRVRPELGEGQHEITVEVVDVAGNTRSQTLPLEVYASVARR